MSDLMTRNEYGALIEPATFEIQRLLPGPIERCWAWLTDSDLRRQWLAAGTMDLKVGAPFELVWRNNELTDPPGQRPDGFGEEHRLQSRIIALEPLRKLSFAWHGDGEVTFELEPRGGEVLLTVTHRRLPDPTVALNVSAGWHAHLDLHVARANDERPQPFWDSWLQLKQDYAAHLPA